LIGVSPKEEQRRQSSDGNDSPRMSRRSRS
jgi:hypothetical protein